MPFENQVEVITLTGESTLALFNYLARVGGHPVSGLTMEMVKNDLDETIPGEILINGQPFDETQTYKVVTSDYLANGGDKMSFFQNPLNREAIGVKLRDAIMEYVIAEQEAGRTLSAQLEGRIAYAK